MVIIQDKISIPIIHIYIDSDTTWCTSKSKILICLKTAKINIFNQGIKNINLL
jgi:hypothetical protein